VISLFLFIFVTLCRYVGNGCYHGRTIHTPPLIPWVKVVPCNSSIVIFFSYDVYFLSDALCLIYGVVTTPEFFSLLVILFMYNCSEVDEIYKICSVIGSPCQDSWAQGLQLADAMKYQFPEVIFSQFDLNYVIFLFCLLFKDKF
jgi:hypothetical protein